MAYEIDVKSSKFDALRQSVIGVRDAAKEAAAAVGDLNGAIGKTTTLKGRVVAAPQSNSEAPSVQAARNSGVLGPRDSRNPYVGGGARQTYERELHSLGIARDIGDSELLRDQEARVERARRRVEADDKLLDNPRESRGGRSSSLDPYGYLGPRSRARRDRAMLARAEATGDEDLIADWRDRAKRSETAVKRLERDPDQAKLDLLMSSRIGADGKLYPLVSRLLAAGGSLRTQEGAEAAASQMQALGMRSVNAPALQRFAVGASPWLLGAGGTALGAGLLYGAAEAGSAVMRRNNDAFYALGGTTGNVGAAIALGGDSASQKAMQLAERLNQGSVGSAYLRSQGIRTAGRYTDYSGNYVRSLDALRGIGDVQERIRVARETGLTEDLWTSDLSPESYRRLKTSRGDAGTPQQRRAEAEYRAAKEGAANTWSKLARAATPAMDLVGSVGRALGGDFGVQEFFSTKVWSARGLFGETIGDWWDERQGGGKPKNNPRSMSYRPAGPQGGWDRSNDRPMGNGPESINGSLNGAVPAGYRGMMMDKALNDQSVQLGWYGG